MRPELDRRFCGRCGEPCGGFEEPAPEIDPPRRCAECAIDVRLPVRLRFWLLSALCCVGLALFTGGATLSLRARLINDGWREPTLLRCFLFAYAGLGLLGGGFHFSREAVREGKHLQRIRRLDRGSGALPPRPRIQEGTRDLFVWRVVQAISLPAAAIGGRVIYLLTRPEWRRSVYCGNFDAGPIDIGMVAAATSVIIISLVYAHLRMRARQPQMNRLAETTQQG